ncbi:uncharacterized protein N7458_006001 [Penicillium daleae]|uniref:Uncharacterized protein n=1 Tax=Penicillium daleae TaxID=63821 RepID=A0AAD6C3G7_9EURO|nr:uncharacterized protein N7458_006001 [Penicillium daleae]KAJ5449552.1 hypothetical protein N7458_006001 [Penicillium daleae]
MEQIPLIGNYSHIHKGVQKNVDAVKADIYRADKQASITGTAVVVAGDITRQVAQHGVTRKVLVTGFDILALTKRSYKEWNGTRYWDITVVVSYYGAVQVYPEGALTSSAAPENASLEELDYSIKCTFGGSWLTPLGPMVGTGTLEAHT